VHVVVIVLVPVPILSVSSSGLQPALVLEQPALVLGFAMAPVLEAVIASAVGIFETAAVEHIAPAGAAELLDVVAAVVAADAADAAKVVGVAEPALAGEFVAGEIGVFG